MRTSVVLVANVCRNVERDTRSEGERRIPAFAQAFIAGGHEFGLSEGWCTECGCGVLTATVEAIAAAASLDATDLYSRLEAGEIHAAETLDGRVEVCLNAPADFWAACGQAHNA